MHGMKNPLQPLNTTSGSRVPWPAMCSRVREYPCVFSLCSLSFLSILSAIGICRREGTGQNGDLLLFQEMEEGQLQSGGVCLGTWRVQFAPERQGWASTPCCKALGCFLFPYTEHRNWSCWAITWSQLPDSKCYLRKQRLQDQHRILLLCEIL